MSGLRIAFRGNFVPNLPWAERASTEHQLALTLEAMGHTVHRLQENAVGWDIVEVVASQADLFLWTQTWNEDPDGAYRFLTRMRGNGIPTVSFHLDLYVGLEREHQIHDQPFWRTDHVFTADGGHDWFFQEAEVNHHWLPPAIYGPEARTGTVDRDAWGFPVVFVGSYPYPHPEHRDARAAIIRTLQQHYPGHHRVYQRGVRLQKLADLCATASVVVGDSCLAGASPLYWSDRVPETLGRGGFLVHPYVEGIEDWYVDGEHIRYFEPGDYNQMVAIINYYLAHPDERARIASAGQALVQARDTYTHRMQAVLTTIGVK